MKKILYIVLILLLVLTACGSKETSKTEEELKAEIRAQLEAEAKLKEEVKAEMEAEKKANKSKEEDNEQENEYVLEGILIPEYPPYTYGIKLDTPETIETNGEKKDFTEIYISYDINGKYVSDYIDRKYMIYDEPVFTVSNEANLKITIKVNNPNDIYTDLNNGHLVADNIEIIELDGISDIKDMTNTKYTLDTYKAIFYLFLPDAIRQDDGTSKKNVKEFSFYINESTESEKLFKDAIDAIYEKGLMINMSKDDYIINENDSTIFDGSEVATGTLNGKNIKEYISLNIFDFQEMLPPKNSMVEEEYDDVFGETNVITILEYLEQGHGLSVYDRMLKEVYDSNAKYDDYIDNFMITNNNYYIDENIYIGMSLEEVYNYCDNNYEGYISIHGDGVTPEKYIYIIPDTNYCITFNENSFESNPNLKDIVESINIFHYNTTIGI